ncbi:MAG: sigma-70 family RNA polymerase sigma factor [Anaerolineae bacterium]|nr:sigma-70 family RNA polymerase sigma factor [Anaerolineae bacterium]
MSIHTDALLLHRFLAGDEAGFEELFQRHYDMVYGVLFRLVGTRQEAEDLAQEVFFKLYKRPLQHGENIAGWLYRVATNMGYNALRANHRRYQRECKAGSDQQPLAAPEEEVTRREVQRQIRNALMAIPERDAKMLVLSQTGFSYQELAEIVGVAPGSVGTLLARAKRTFLVAYDGGK